jgi:molybdopterin molybdotransferase
MAAGFERIFWQVAIRPGKPLLFGRLGTTLVAGLPGRPGSTAVCLEARVIPLLRRLQGSPDPGWPCLPATLVAPVTADSWRTTLLPGRLEWADGSRFHPLSGHSGQHHDYAAMQALLAIPPGTSLPAGAGITPWLTDAGLFFPGGPV